MAKPQVILLLDSGALIAAGKSENIEAIVRRWRLAGAQFVIAAPSIAESIRGGPKDAPANRLINAISHVEPTTEHISRNAGALLGIFQSKKTIDAIIVATATHCRVTDILTSDPDDMRLLAGDSLNIYSI